MKKRGYQEYSQIDKDAASTLASLIGLEDPKRRRSSEGALGSASQSHLNVTASSLAKQTQVQQSIAKNSALEQGSVGVSLGEFKKRLSEQLVRSKQILKDFNETKSRLDQYKRMLNEFIAARHKAQSDLNLLSPNSRNSKSLSFKAEQNLKQQTEKLRSHINNLDVSISEFKDLIPLELEKLAILNEAISQEVSALDSLQEPEQVLNASSATNSSVQASSSHSRAATLNMGDAPIPQSLQKAFKGVPSIQTGQISSLTKNTDHDGEIVVRKGNVRNIEINNTTLDAYWDACDKGNYRKVAEIVSEEEKITAFCRGAKQDKNSENAFHIVAKKNDLELFFALKALDVNPCTFVKKDARGKIPLQVAMESNASIDVKKALACKTTINLRFPEAIKAVCEVFGVPHDIPQDDLRSIQVQHIKLLVKSNLAKKYGNTIPQNLDAVLRTKKGQGNNPAVASDDIGQRVSSLYSNVFTMGSHNLSLTKDLPEWERFFNAMNNDAKSKLAAVNTFLQWTSLQYLQTQEICPEGDMKASIINAEKLFAKVYNGVAASVPNAGHSR